MTHAVRNFPPMQMFSAWTSLFTKSIEMAAASAFVIPHRVNRMMSAGCVPNQRDQREFRLMGDEKIEAMMQSSLAMAPRVFEWYLQWWLMGWRQMLSASTRLPLTMPGGWSDVCYRPAQAKRDLAAHWRMAHLATRIAHHGIVPLHAKATANAKRLAKVKK